MHAYTLSMCVVCIFSCRKNNRVSLANHCKTIALLYKLKFSRAEITGFSNTGGNNSAILKKIRTKYKYKSMRLQRSGMLEIK